MKILLISDIHANFRALQAVLDFHSEADEIWCQRDGIGERVKASL